MKRLWRDRGLRGLLVRREKEAELFERGLDAMRILEKSELLTLDAADTAVENGDSPRVFDALDRLSEEELAELLYEPGSDEDKDVVEPEKMVSLEESLPCSRKKSHVRWVRDDQYAPDYRHLPPDAKNATFDFTSADMERLITANRFKPHTGSHGKILFGLRGCRSVGSGHAQEARTTLRLQDVRPNHRDFRCVIGVYDRSTKQLSAYTVSTVPNAGGVLSYYNRINCSGGDRANMLPTGCYELCVGTHRGKKVTVPGVFRLGDGPEPKDSSEATVLRTRNDVIYGTQDGIYASPMTMCPLPLATTASRHWVASLCVAHIGEAGSIRENGKSFVPRQV